MPNDQAELPTSPFAVEPITLGWVPNRTLDSQLRTLLDQPQFKHMGIAIVDLTHRSSDPNSPSQVRYAGLRDEQQIFVGSLPKIAIMLAAYRLREQVREAAVRLRLNETGALFPRLVKSWTPLLTKQAQGRPVMFPKLDQVFRADGFADAQEIEFHDDFDAHIVKMIEGVGKNDAAAYCAQRLGFAYINGVLQTEGLQDGPDGSRGPRGLSLALDYAGNFWTGSESAATAQGATAKSVAAFMTALENRNLVSPQASEEMTSHMLVASSWFKAGLVEKKRPPSRIYGKIGVAGTFSEGAVIEHLVKGSGLRRYAAVVLGASGYPPLWEAVVDLDIISSGT